MSDKKFNRKQMLAGLAVLVAVGGASFYGGMRFGKSGFGSSAGTRQLTFFRQGTAGGQNVQFGGANGGQRMGGRSGAGFVSGEIMSMDDKSLTMRSRDGGSKIVLLAGSTEVSKFTAGSLTDLQVGMNVMVTGRTNSDGSVTAQTIQLRPALPPGGFQGGAGLPLGDDATR